MGYGQHISEMTINNIECQKVIELQCGNNPNLNHFISP